MRQATLMNLIFALLCVITVTTACFDCVVSLATAEELCDRRAPTEDNPIWSVFLENGTVRAMVGLKFMGVFFASVVMYVIRNDRTLRFAVMVPVALFHIWLFMTLNFGVSGNMFAFDFSDPFFLFRHLTETLQMGIVQ